MPGFGSVDLRNIVLTTIAVVSLFIGYKKYRINNTHNATARTGIKDKGNIYFDVDRLALTSSYTINIQYTNSGNRPVRIFRLPFIMYQIKETRTGKRISISYNPNYENTPLESAGKHPRDVPGLVNGFVFGDFMYYNSKNKLMEGKVEGITSFNAEDSDDLAPLTFKLISKIMEKLRNDNKILEPKTKHYGPGKLIDEDLDELAEKFIEFQIE